MASCKGYRASGRSKKAKKNAVITNFLKIETRLKVPYMRLKGIPEGGRKPCKQRVLEGAIKEQKTFPLFLMFLIYPEENYIYIANCVLARHNLHS